MIETRGWRGMGWGRVKKTGDQAERGEDLGKSKECFVFAVNKNEE